MVAMKRIREKRQRDGSVILERGERALFYNAI
jgi:hypothetical protein